MKKTTAICLLFASVHAYAGMVVTEKMEATGADGKATTTFDMVMKIKGDKVRVDAGDMESEIGDVSTNDWITLQHARKIFMKFTGKKSDAKDTEAKKPANADGGEPAKITDTGKQEKVGDYAAEIYTAQSSAVKYTFWVARDFPNADAVRSSMNKLHLIQEGGSNVAPDIKKFDGVLVKLVMVAHGETVTLTLVSAKEEPVDDAEFQVPTGYEDGAKAAKNDAPDAKH